MLTKLLIITLLLAILASLFSALRAFLKPKDNSSNMAKALTWRIALSITLFLMLVLLFAFGVIQPHTLQGRISTHQSQ